MPDRLVYSTDGGRVSHCPVCGQPYKQCRCDQSTSETPNKLKGPPQAPLRSDGIVRITRDRKHRGGKTVTVISGIPASSDSLTSLAQQLKKLCGSGGSVKDGTIEIQGDHCDKVQAKLTELGYKVKRAGG
jgi:translation initiation factor 1